MKQKENSQRPINKFRVFIRKYWWALIIPALIILLFLASLISSLVMLIRFEVTYNQLKEVHRVLGASEADLPVKSCREVYYGFNSAHECRVSLEVPVEERDRGRMKSVTQKAIDDANLKSAHIDGSEEKGIGGFTSNSGLLCSVFWGEPYVKSRDISISVGCRYNVPYHLPGYTKTEP